MKVIITGGSGLLGRALTDSLTKDGHEIIILSRSPEKVRDLPPGARAVAWDAKTAKGWGHLADGAEAIVNLAGASLKGEGFIPSRWTKKRKQLIRSSRLDAGAAVVDAVRQAVEKPGVVIQSSAIGYYGPRADERLDENAAPGDDFLANVCITWETSTKEVEELGVRRCVARTGLPLTNEGGAFPLLALPFKLFSGNTFGNGRQYYSWIHPDDHVAAIRFLLENSSASGVFNLTAPEPVTNRQFARTLGKVMRRPVWLQLPRFVLELVLGEVATVVMDGQRVVPNRLEEAGFEFQYPRLEPTLRAILDK